MEENKSNEKINVMVFFFVLGGIFAMFFLPNKPSDTLTSSKLINPSVKINCVEVDGSKECDTTYTYKK